MAKMPSAEYKMIGNRRFLLEVDNSDWETKSFDSEEPTDEMRENPDLQIFQKNWRGDIRFKSYRPLTDRAICTVVRKSVLEHSTKPPQLRPAVQATPRPRSGLLHPAEERRFLQVTPMVRLERAVSSSEWSGSCGSESPTEDMRLSPEQTYFKYNRLGDLKGKQWDESTGKMVFTASRKAARVGLEPAASTSRHELTPPPREDEVTTRPVDTREALQRALTAVLQRARDTSAARGSQLQELRTPRAQGLRDHQTVRSRPPREDHSERVRRSRSAAPVSRRRLL